MMSFLNLFKKNNVKHHLNYPGPCAAFLSGEENKIGTIQRIVNFSDEQLENSHTYIQHVFPLKEHSNFNSSAPVLSDEEVNWINSEEGNVARNNLKKMFLRMLDFYGMSLVNKNGHLLCILNSNFHDKADNWFHMDNHNYLRITRILKSLRLLGLEEHALAFYNALSHLYENYPDKISEETFNYWTDAIIPLRIIALSDTHHTISVADVNDFISEHPNFDCVISLGDVEHNLLKYICDHVDNKPILGILGNHDELKLYDELSIIDMHMNSYSIRNFTFAGLQGSIKYKNNDNFPLITDEESVNLVRKLPKADVFLTHDGPKDNTLTFPHNGLEGISYYIDKNAPAFHLYGHRHFPCINKIHNTTSMCLYKLSYLELFKD